MCRFPDIHGGAIISKVGEDYTEVDKSSENTGTKTTNRRRGNLSEINRGDDNGLANT
jgi:hypothetical protein